MALPKITELELPDSNVFNNAAAQAVHQTFEWDFASGDFKLDDGKLVPATHQSYIRIWIQKALRTVKNGRIYAGTNYGSEHHSLIGRNFKPAFSQAEYERMIREALLQNSAITRVENFDFTTDGSWLAIQFDVISIYGTITEQAVI